MESSTNRQVNQSLPATVITHKSFLLPRLFQLAVVLLSALTVLQPALALDELATIDPLAPMDGPGERNIGWQWHYVDSDCLLYTSPSPRDLSTSRMPSSA